MSTTHYFFFFYVFSMYACDGSRSPVLPVCHFLWTPFQFCISIRVAYLFTVSSDCFCCFCLCPNFLMFFFLVSFLSSARLYFICLPAFYSPLPSSLFPSSPSPLPLFSSPSPLFPFHLLILSSWSILCFYLI